MGKVETYCWFLNLYLLDTFSITFRFALKCEECVQYQLPGHGGNLLGPSFHTRTKQKAVEVIECLTSVLQAHLLVSMFEVV